jgi:putative DNA primase/helicase
VDPRGTLAEHYLAGRGLDLGEDIAGDVLRWHPGIRAMLALFRDIRTDELRAICRTFLDHVGRKIERKFFGPVGGCAIKLDADEEVRGGLHVAEGVETAMAARQLGLRPTWALGSAGAVAAFPVLGGIECLTLLAEHCEVNARAVKQCAARWYEAGREVIINEPKRGKDLNDALLRRARP